MPIYNVIEYSNNYSKTSEILWQYYRDEQILADDNTITDFNETLLLLIYLGPLLKSGLPLVGNVFRPLAKTVIIPLGLETHQH